MKEKREVFLLQKQTVVQEKTTTKICMYHFASHKIKRLGRRRPDLLGSGPPSAKPTVGPTYVNL